MQMKITLLPFLLVVSKVLVVALNSENEKVYLQFPKVKSGEFSYDEFISNPNYKRIDVDLDTSYAYNSHTRYPELPQPDIEKHLGKKIMHENKLQQNSTKIESLENNPSNSTRTYVRIREGRHLQDGVDFSFIVDKPVGEWSGEEWAYFFLLFSLVFIFGCCCCCACCLGPMIASCCRSRGYTGNYSYGSDYGRYHRNRNSCCCCCNRGSSCVQDLFCLWCFWELCCTDDIIDSGGYQEGGW